MYYPVKGEDCPPLYDSAVPLPFQFAAGMACAFACVVGERMCDETLNPGNEGMEKDFFEREESMPYCARSNDEVPTEDTREWHDNEGVKRIEKITTYSSGCEEYVQYIEVCNQKGQECQEIEIYSEEWYAYKREMQMKAYEESCSIATEEDCTNIEAEMGQCMLDLAENMLEAYCSFSKDALWRYRKRGIRMFMFGGVKKSKPIFNNQGVKPSLSEVPPSYVPKERYSRQK